MAAILTLPVERPAIQTGSLDSNPTTTPQPACELCGGEGRVVAERDERGFIRYMRPCECQRSERIRRRIPARYSRAKLSDFKPSTREKVIAWLRDKKSPGLLLFGPVGVGKTFFAFAILRALLEAGHDAVAVNAANFYRELRSAFNSDNESEEQIFGKYVTVPWLVFDDAGAGALTDFERRYLLDLLDQRASRRTIITSNLTIEEFGKRLDERIGSRLSEFMLFHCGGADRRAARNKQPAI